MAKRNNGASDDKDSPTSKATDRYLIALKWRVCVEVESYFH
jgi:hypothetical protein